MKFTLALVMAASIAEASWKSGSISTYEKFTHGKIVAKMKVPNKKGTVASIFTFWDGPGFYPGGWNEIDMNVVPSMSDTPLSTNIVYGDGRNKMEDHAYHGSSSLDDDWHTYSIEWTPDYISWSIDDAEVKKVSAGYNESVQLLNKQQSLRLNYWTPTFHAWGADFNPNDMPWYLLFDYVELYNWDAETKEFDLAWHDDFDFFDQSRWHKLSGTFDGNSSVFYPQNAFVEGGKLVLKMEPSELHHHDDHRVDHHHYDSELHRQESTIRHMERDPLIRDALHPIDDLPSYLGHGLTPKVGGSLKPRKDYEPDLHALHLHPTHHERRYHDMYRVLDHAYDDQHDIEPVHFHEHALEKPAKTTDQQPVPGLSLIQQEGHRMAPRRHQMQETDGFYYQPSGHHISGENLDLAQSITASSAQGSVTITMPTQSSFSGSASGSFSGSGSASFSGSAYGSALGKSSSSRSKQATGSYQGAAQGSFSGSASAGGSSQKQFSSSQSKSASGSYQGSASGSYQGSASATGSQQKQSQSSRSTQASGQYQGSASGSYSGSASATGSQQKQASGSFKGSASGSSKGQASASYQGSASASGSYSGQASSSKSKQGSASYQGSASTSGSYKGFGSASYQGQGSYQGSASGSYSGSASASGQQKTQTSASQSKQASASYSGQTQGSQTRQASAQGSQTWQASTQGSQSRQAQAQGSQSRQASTQGSQTWQASAQGSQSRQAQAQGSQSRQTSAQGSQSRQASAQGSQSRQTSAQGSQSRQASAQGSQQRQASAQGSQTRQASAQGSYQKQTSASTSISGQGSASASFQGQAQGSQTKQADISSRGQASAQYQASASTSQSRSAQSQGQTQSKGSTAIKTQPQSEHGGFDWTATVHYSQAKDQPHKDSKAAWHEEILDETPYEHNHKQVHEGYHLDDHFFDSDYKQPSLYHRLQDHYDHSHFGGDEDHGHWEGVVYEVPVPHQHGFMDREHHFQAHTEQDHEPIHYGQLGHHSELDLAGDLAHYHEISHFADEGHHGDLTHHPDVGHFAGYSPHGDLGHIGVQSHHGDLGHIGIQDHHGDLSHFGVQDHHGDLGHIGVQDHHGDLIHKQPELYHFSSHFIDEGHHAELGHQHQSVHHPTVAAPHHPTVSAPHHPTVSTPHHPTESVPHHPQSLIHQAAHHEAVAPFAVREHSPHHKGYFELPLAGPLFKDVNSKDVHHMFMDLPRDLSQSPHLQHEFDDHGDYDQMHKAQHHGYPEQELYHSRFGPYRDGMTDQELNQSHELTDAQHEGYAGAYHFETLSGQEADTVDPADLEFEVLAQEKDKPAKKKAQTKQSPKPAQKKEAPTKAAEPQHKKQLHQPMPHPAEKHHPVVHHAPTHHAPAVHHSHVVAEHDVTPHHEVVSHHQVVPVHHQHEFVHHDLPVQPHHEAALTQVVYHEPIHHAPHEKPAPQHATPSLHHEKLPKKRMDHHYEYEYPDEHSYRRYPGEAEPKDIHEREVHGKHSAWRPAYAYAEDEHEHSSQGQPLHEPELGHDHFETAYGREHGLYHQQQTRPHHAHPGHVDEWQESDVHDSHRDTEDKGQDWHTEDHDIEEEIAKKPHPLHEMQEFDVDIQPLFEDYLHHHHSDYGWHELPTHSYEEEQSYEHDPYGHTHEDADQYYQQGSYYHDHEDHHQYVEPHEDTGIDQSHLEHYVPYSAPWEHGPTEADMESYSDLFASQQ